MRKLPYSGSSGGTTAYTKTPPFHSGVDCGSYTSRLALPDPSRGNGWAILSVAVAAIAVVDGAVVVVGGCRGNDGWGGGVGGDRSGD